jgi:gliding motility-associated-like protein
VNPSITTTYTVTGTTGFGCTGSSSVTVIINQNPIVFITAPQDTICAGSSTNLVGNGAASYVWMPSGSTTQIFSVSPTTTTTYSVIGSTLGCTGTASTSISVFDSLVITASASPDLICVGQSSNLVATGANVYFWMPTGFTADSISVSPPFTTTYTVWGNTDNCPGMNTVTVNVIPNPTMDITANDTILCPGNFLKLCAPYGFDTYLWNNGSDTDCIVINSGGNYIVHVTNGMGCAATDSIYIEEACESLIWYPNSFTPNDDGKNDYFTIVGDNIKSFEIWIYNRWGELLFYSDNIEKSWDGIYHNNPVPPGIYVWYMIYESYYAKMVTYKHDLTGIVNVIR